MIINHAEDGHGAEGLDEKTALPSKHVISSFGSITNGFLFSTTPIILKILQTICNNVSFVVVDDLVVGRIRQFIYYFRLAVRIHCWNSIIWIHWRHSWVLQGNDTLILSILYWYSF